MSSAVDSRVASLLDRHTIGFVVRALVRLGATRAEADDLAQEVLVTALTAQTFDASRRLEPWLWGIARAHYRDFRKLAWNRRVELSESSHEIAAANAPRGKDELLAQALAHALQALPDDQQALLVLHDLEQWPLAECADAVRLSPDAARYRLGVARATLRKQLAPKLQETRDET